MPVHPAALLVLWGGFAFFLQWAPSEGAVATAAACLVAALLFARRRSRSLLRRSRWLLLSLAVLFLFFTPGEYLPGMAGDIGITREGMANAGTHLGRLIALLASLALLHEKVGTQGLVAGLYGLLGRSGVGERTVVRLMLVLDQVERQEKTDWRAWLSASSMPAGTEVLHLHLPPMRAVDRWLVGSMLLAILVVGLVT